ncbi:hypothetical protein Y032_0651g1148 [Ancylostoma ceylanicum]|uniref:Uncharacterized protein n=1 Tax=Ancylostoma ceylanicum TaxID=53326 RepID=A0A016WJ10_9BILA|nr:hypothetical protein Y032_0651g1148 [Ancylostoma ceylanicum]
MSANKSECVGQAKLSTFVRSPQTPLSPKTLQLALSGGINGTTMDVVAHRSYYRSLACLELCSCRRYLYMQHVKVDALLHHAK